jgi:hypothetical protein
MEKFHIFLANCKFLIIIRYAVFTMNRSKGRYINYRYATVFMAELKGGGR